MGAGRGSSHHPRGVTIRGSAAGRRPRALLLFLSPRPLPRLPLTALPAAPPPSPAGPRNAERATVGRMAALLELLRRVPRDGHPEGRALPLRPPEWRLHPGRGRR